MQVKYDLSDWERRKADLLPVLDAAATEGLVAREQAGKLADFLLGRGVGVGPAPAISPAASDASGLNAPIDREPYSVNEESEMPRFIRGFHDILITIGIIIGLLGLGGLASPYAVIPASIVLAEILVRRQRLALPAVVLTIAVGFSMALGISPAIEESGLGLTDGWKTVVYLFLVALVTLGFFWRYKVPVALSAGLVSAFGGGIVAAGLMTLTLAKDEDFFLHHPKAFPIYLGVFALLVFGTALRFDVADRLRITRRSDVAFWMHLAAAPALLYTVMAFLYTPGQGNWFSSLGNAYQASGVVVAVAVLMLIGIVLDRRAFVTSGLASLGYAAKVLLTEGGFAKLISSTDTLAFTILLAIGVIVLSLGIGWQPLRRLIVGNLPVAIRDRVPPVR